MNIEVITREPKSNRKQTPILFVHGAWHGAWCWDEYFLPYFAENGYSSYALSLRGHGNSEGRDQLLRVSLDDYVADIAQVAGQISSPPVLVGHSMGGLVVGRYIERYQVPAAVLIASTHKGVLSTFMRLGRRHPVAFLESILTMRGKKSGVKGELFSEGMPPERVATYFARLQDEPFISSREFKPPKLEGIKTPILVLGARNDTIIHTDQVEATARDYQTEAEIFPDMAHDMMLEDGWENVADRILSWLHEQGL